MEGGDSAEMCCEGRAGRRPRKGAFFIEVFLRVLPIAWGNLSG
jgi:hypothetical protein